MLTATLQIKLLDILVPLVFIGLCFGLYYVFVKKAKPDPREEDVTDITRNFKVYHGGKKKAG